jgi:chemotaxis receptor (MCP) glutamine deamidase CheD
MGHSKSSLGLAEVGAKRATLVVALTGGAQIEATTGVAIGDVEEHLLCAPAAP